VDAERVTVEERPVARPRWRPGHGPSPRLQPPHPPPWWPEGEGWPPPAWHDGRRRFLRRVGCFFGLVVGLMIAASTLGAIFGGGHDGPPFGFFGVLLLIVVVVAAGRVVRRTAAPIADVMAAADRVADGDYAVRVRTRADGEVGRLVNSFNAMTIRLEATEAQRRNLLADVAHELRTPLAVIQGNVEGMLDGVYPRDDVRLETLLEETTVMSRLLEDLRTLSLAEARALRLHREGIDPADLVADVVAAYTPRAVDAGIELRGEVPQPPPPEIEADPVRLRQVLENLVANSLRHTPRGGRVRVEAALRPGAVAFSVVDTGQGIAPEQLPHIFDRFWKSADSGGSGLGLAIAKGLVEAHGGTISAESRPGRGTAMRFTVPTQAIPQVPQRIVPRTVRSGAKATG
jgi:two-component system sensor histidine kinase BaeS